MTRRGNSRLAGVAFLLYILTGMASMYIMTRFTPATDGAGAAVTALTNQEMPRRANAALTLLQAAYAVILAVTLYALTRDEDREIAMLGLCSRLTEGLIGAVSAVSGLALVQLANASKTATGADASFLYGVESLVREAGSASVLVAATCFAIGSTLFSYLFLRARTIPMSLAWVGVIASVLLVIALPLRMLGIADGGMTVWMPMLVFEVWFALWLIFKGVAPPARNVPTASIADPSVP